ncbi:MAG: hypothetical protein ACJ76I_07645 [Gaiellaceae bacterium]
MPRRTTFSLVLALLALSAASAQAAEHQLAGIAPSLVHQGQRTTITAPTRGLKSLCGARLSFADKRVQTLAPKRPRNGRVSFVTMIAKDAAIGSGTWFVSCKSVIVAAGSFVVVAAISTSGADLPRVVVSKQGYSQRPDRYGTGSQLSYGILLHNTSDTEDARNVYVIVNMVTATGELIGSVSRTIPLVPAGGTYGLGDSMGLRTQVAATSLEITIRVGAHEPKKAHTMPDFANVQILPGAFDPGYVSEVDGEVVNDNSPLTLTSANLSIVILDAAGNPIGGGTGSSGAALPPNSRFVFLAQSGFSAIPLDKAAAVLISVAPTYAAAF